MGNERHNDEELKEQFGMRHTGTPIISPQEIGYRCPEGHSNITWSEFKKHIWCYTCKKDFHYARDCILIEDKHNPKNLEEQPRIITGIEIFKPDGNHFNDVPKELLEES